MSSNDGRPTRVAQWLIELEAPVDVTALLRPDDGLEALEQRAAEATAVLEGRASKSPKVNEDGLIDVDEAVGGCAVSPESTMPEVTSAARAAKRPTAAEAREQRVPRPFPAAPARNPDPAALTMPQGDIAWILDASTALGVPADRFEQYAEKRWGKGWKLAAGGRKRALDEVSAFAEDPDGFREKVKAELEVFS